MDPVLTEKYADGMTRTAQYTKLNIRGIEKQLPDYIINLFNKHEKYIKSE